MNKNIKLAVAGAVIAMSASAANAGIIIPAGDWTLDINGNVNAYMNFTDTKSAPLTLDGGALATARPTTGNSNIKGINTGLLPAWLGFTGKTRQNDLDVEFTISMQPAVSDNGATGDGAGGGSAPSQFLNRQTYVSFGDKSWGSIKLGKDLGIFASDAILNDMTLLGVGAGANISGSPINTTLGGIGTGYLYAAWKGQVAYTTPNFNGFQATIGLMNPNQGFGSASQSRFGVEGKASYAFNANDVSGKVWVSGLSNRVTTTGVAGTPGSSVDNIVCSGPPCNAGSGNLVTTTITLGAVDAVPSYNYNAQAADVGVNFNAGGFGVTGYYYKGKGVGTTLVGLGGINAEGQRRDSDGGYLQATYVLPFKTKLGIAWGQSNLDRVGSDGVNTLKSNERSTFGVYHPLTKHLNLVGELNHIKSESHAGAEAKSTTGSLGAILFF